MSRHASSFSGSNIGLAFDHFVRSYRLNEYEHEYEYEYDRSLSELHWD